MYRSGFAKLVGPFLSHLKFFLFFPFWVGRIFLGLSKEGVASHLKSDVLHIDPAVDDVIRLSALHYYVYRQ